MEIIYTGSPGPYKNVLSHLAFIELNTYTLSVWWFVDVTFFIESNQRIAHVQAQGRGDSADETT